MHGQTSFLRRRTDLLSSSLWARVNQELLTSPTVGDVRMGYPRPPPRVPPPLRALSSQAPSSKQSVVSRQTVVSDHNSTLTGRTHDWLNSPAPARRSPGEKLNTYLRRLRVGESWHFSRRFLVFHDDGIQPPRTFAARGRPYYPVGSLRAPKWHLRATRVPLLLPGVGKFRVYRTIPPFSPRSREPWS